MSDTTSAYRFIEQTRRAYRTANYAPPDAERYPGVAAIYETIWDQLFDSDLRLEDAYAEHGLRNHNIALRFREVLGRSPRGFARHHRVALAKELLERDDLLIAQVAGAVGYEHPSSFTKRFKAETGQTPTQYRQGD